MGRSLGKSRLAVDLTASVPIGGYANVFAAGESYRATGSLVQRSQFPELSAAFPRRGAYSFAVYPQGQVGSSSQSMALTYGAGRFVHLMASTTTNPSSDCMYSQDGINWVAMTMATSLVWNGICYGRNLFVAVGGAQQAGTTNQLNTSPDGITWTARSFPAAAIWKTVCWSEALGLFVAISLNGQNTATSPDGVTWTARGALPGGAWNQVIAGPTCLVAVGETGVMARSVDGLTWTAVTSSVKNWGSVVYGNGLFVAMASSSSSGASVVTSPDGIIWTTRVTPSAFAGGYLLAGDGVFVGATGGTAIISYDGITWSIKSSGLPTTVHRGAFGAGAFLFTAPFNSGSTTYNSLISAESLTSSDWMAISGTAGQFVRVR